jgi:hypothetical protein
MIRKLLFVCTVLLCAADASAQTVTDERVWFTMTFQEPGNAGSPWRWTFETYFRGRDGVDELDSMGLRPTLIYAVTPHSAVGGGYAFVPLFPVSGGTLIENRVYGQFGWSIAAAGGTLALRTRMEVRFVESNSGPAGRFRQQVRFTHAFRKGSRLSWSAYDEIFVHTNSTTRAARGIDSNRIFGGVAMALPHELKVDLGYINQFSPGHRGAPDRMYHILSSALTKSF